MNHTDEAFQICNPTKSSSYLALKLKKELAKLNANRYIVLGAVFLPIDGARAAQGAVAAEFLRVSPWDASRDACLNRASMASFLTSMASSGALRNAKMSDTDITIARAKSGSLRLKLEETDAAYEYDIKHELRLAQLAKSRIAVLDAAAEKVKARAIVTRGNVADLQEQLAMEAEVERVEVLRRCDILEAEREVKARQAIVRERQGDRHRNKSMRVKVIVMRARKQLHVDDSADKMQGIERKQERASTLARSRTEERLKVLKAQTEDRERRLVDGQAVRDNLAQGRSLFRERTRQRLNERSAHVDATRADIASAQAERDFAASEARKSTAEFGKSLSEGKLQMSASQHGQSAVWAVPQRGSGASSRRA